VGALIEVSLLESLLDFQFELLTTYFSSKRVPQRSKHNNGHTLLSAPYGIYPTAEGFIAIAMVPLSKLSAALDCKELSSFNQQDAFRKRDEIKEILNKHLSTQGAEFWVNKLQQHGIWSTAVLDWLQMKDHEAYQVLEMEQKVGSRQKGFITTRCPIRINGEKLVSAKPAPLLGEQNEKVLSELYNAKA
jgi:crotonobetainyl-CoA:carnitine CoA-transferase CaiB-like acyl-CoA transferase